MIKKYEAIEKRLQNLQMKNMNVFLTPYLLGIVHSVFVTDDCYMTRVWSRAQRFQKPHLQIDFLRQHLQVFPKLFLTDLSSLDQ